LDNRITYPDIDLIFMRCTRANHRDLITGQSKALVATMQYDQFVDALEVLALKKFPDVARPPDALERLLTEHILPYAARKETEGEEEMQELLVPELMEIFRRFKRPLQAIFMYYCARNKVASATWETIAKSNVTMGIGKFLLFAREFDLLPHVVTKQHLVAIYRLTNQSPEESDQGLNYSEFTESLGRIGTHWATKGRGVAPGEFSPGELSEQVLTLLGVMDESEGMVTVLESIGRTHSRAYSLQASNDRTAQHRYEEAEAGGGGSFGGGGGETSRTNMSGEMSYRSTNTLQEGPGTARSLSASQLTANDGSVTYNGQSYRFVGAGQQFTSTTRRGGKKAVAESQGSSMFKSRTKRLGFGPKEVTPAPGLYNPSKPEWIKWGEGSGVADMTAPRFPSKKAQHVNAHVAQYWEPRRKA